MFPFKEKLLKENYYLREFKNTVTRDEMVWHRDKEDRLITLVEGEGWKLQLDNKLPFDLEKGKAYFIAKETWHRIIKGDTNLKIIVEKKDRVGASESYCKNTNCDDMGFSQKASCKSQGIKDCY